MEEFYDYIGSLGIAGSPDVPRAIEKLGPGAVLQVATRCYELTEVSVVKPKSSSQFNFAAGSSMGGGAESCASLECRIKSLYHLGVFASLYADEVYIPNFFEYMYHKPDFKDGWQYSSFLEGLTNDILLMLYLKPLVDAGIIHINPKLRTYCQDCLAKKIQADASLFQKLKVVEKKVATDMATNVGVVLEKDNYVHLVGGDFHRGVLFENLPKDLSIYGRRAPYRFSAKEALQLGLFDYFLDPIFQDLIAQKYAMKHLNVSYITDRKIEKNIIRKLDGVDSAGSSRIAELPHNLPFITGTSLESLVNLRKKESTAFATYRDAVRLAIKTAENESNPIALKDIVQDIIEPEIRKIDHIVQTEQSEIASKAKTKIAINAGIISMGWFANYIGGVDIGMAMTTMGGLFAAKDIALDLSSIGKTPVAAKNSDYYFLWAVKNLPKH